MTGVIPQGVAGKIHKLLAHPAYAKTCSAPTLRRFVRSQVRQAMGVARLPEDIGAECDALADGVAASRVARRAFVEMHSMYEALSQLEHAAAGLSKTRGEAVDLVAKMAWSAHDALITLIADREVVAQSAGALAYEGFKI